MKGVAASVVTPFFIVIQQQQILLKRSKVPIDYLQFFILL